MRVTQAVFSVLAIASIASAKWSVGFYPDVACRGDGPSEGADGPQGCTNLNYKTQLSSADLTGDGFKVTLYCEDNCGGAHPMGLTGGCVTGPGDCPNIKSYKVRCPLLIFIRIASHTL